MTFASQVFNCKQMYNLLKNDKYLFCIFKCNKFSFVVLDSTIRLYCKNCRYYKGLFRLSVCPSTNFTEKSRRAGVMRQKIMYIKIRKDRKFHTEKRVRSIFKKLKN